MKPDCAAEVWVYLACAMFFLGLYKEAEEAASKGKANSAYTLVLLCSPLFAFDVHHNITIVLRCRSYSVNI